MVLGGTSVFGGRGTVVGTLLGLFFLSILQERDASARTPFQDSTGVLIGILLLVIVSADRLRP